MLAGDSLKHLLQKQSENQKEGGDQGVVTGDLSSVSDAATNASRAMHSLYDVDASLIATLPIGGDAAAASASASSFNNSDTAPSLISAVAELIRIIQSVEFSGMTRLHAAGAILLLRRALVLERRRKLVHHCRWERRNWSWRCNRALTRLLFPHFVHSFNQTIMLTRVLLWMIQPILLIIATPNS